MPDTSTHDTVTNALVNVAITALNGLLQLPAGRERATEVLAWLVRHMSAEAWHQYQHYAARCYAADPDAPRPGFAAWLAARLWIETAGGHRDQA